MYRYIRIFKYSSFSRFNCRYSSLYIRFYRINYYNFEFIILQFVHKIQYFWTKKLNYHGKGRYCLYLNIYAAASAFYTFLFLLFSPIFMRFLRKQCYYSHNPDCLYFIFVSLIEIKMSPIQERTEIILPP